MDYEATDYEETGDRRGPSIFERAYGPWVALNALADRFLGTRHARPPDPEVKPAETWRDRPPLL